MVARRQRSLLLGSTAARFMNTRPQTIQLEAPGNGLRPFEAFLNRWVLFPFFVTLMSPQKAVQMLTSTGQDILELAHQTPTSKRSKPVLIQRIPGIEDSSRNWSIDMTLEHLLITSESMAEIAETLGNKRRFHQEVRTEDVKPTGELDTNNIQAQYETFLERYPSRIQNIRHLDNCEFRHLHPWFWQLTAKQWLCLNALHHKIHLRQICEILKSLSEA